GSGGGVLRALRRRPPAPRIRPAEGGPSREARGEVSLVFDVVARWDRWMASRPPIGRIGNTSNAFLSRTTVGFFSPSIKCRPTSKLVGVTRASQRLGREGVRHGSH